jgi:hypothetical protein
MLYTVDFWVTMGIMSVLAFLVDDLTSADFRRNAAVGKALASLLAVVDDRIRDNFIQRMEKLTIKLGPEEQKEITMKEGSPDYPYVLFMACLPEDKQILIGHALTFVSSAGCTPETKEKIRAKFAGYAQ